jgi:putative NADH-flavin reductase
VPQTFALIALILFGYGVQAGEPLDIVVYGATGEVGSEIVQEALNRGHRVTAVSRDPASMKKQHPKLEIVKGNVLDPDSVASIVAGRDVVVLSVRGVIGDSGQAESALQFLAAEKLVDALYPITDHPPRLLHIGGAGSLEVRPGVLFADTLPALFLPKNLEIEIAGQILALEFYRKVDDVRWTYITPPRNFTNGPRTGQYRIGGDRMLEDREGESRLSRADFAVAVIDEAERNAHERERISLAY